MKSSYVHAPLLVCPPALKRLPVWTILYPTEKVKLEKSSSIKLALFASVVLMSIGDCLEPPQSAYPSDCQ